MRHDRKAQAARVAAVLALVAGTIGCDRMTKQLAVSELSGGGVRSFLGQTVRVEYAENPGAFLSLGADLPAWARLGLFTFGPAVLLVGLGIAALRRRFTGPTLVGASLVWAGGLSNLVDRVVRGSVVDFLSVGVGPLRTGVFNVADLAITVGVVLVVTRSFGSDRS